MVLELLGPDLEELFELCGQKFSAKTVAMVARQMVNHRSSIYSKILVAHIRLEDPVTPGDP